MAPNPSIGPLRPTLRAAREADHHAVSALMAPEIALGALLPRQFRAEEFLVAELEGVVVGAVGLKAWDGEVVELGSLVAGLRGAGLGRALVEAAVDEAARRGYRHVVALTGLEGFFEAHGFRAVGETPWQRARGLRPLRPDAELSAANGAKARVCAACPRLGECRQQLFARPLASAVQATA